MSGNLWCTVCGTGHPIERPCPARQPQKDEPFTIRREPPVQARGRTTVTLTFDADALRAMSSGDAAFVAKLLLNLVTGDPTERRDWTRSGIDVFIA